MAAQLEGGAFLSSFIDALLNKLSSLDVNSIPGGERNQKLLQRLMKSLLAPRPVLDDAERKQIKDQQVKKWLTDLQDAVYKADDLLDEVSTKAATAAQRDTGNSSWFHGFVDSELEDSEKAIVNRMEEITKTLESIVELKVELGLKEISKEEYNSKEDMSWRITTSLVKSSDIYGRDKDKEAILELLLDDTWDAELPIISIVGIGGVGKTTLAQLVYNDDKVKGKFHSKAWVCVAEKFDVLNITKTVMKAITSSSCDKDDLDLLQIDLKEKLTGKTFLIVLDDVWNECSDEWDTLLKPFQYGNKGSKILLTTRHEKVASFVMPSIPYKLSLLTENDCWSVFFKHSFLSKKSREYADLEQIGREIVKKCKGLPLAAKTLGGLLRTKREVSQWNDILKSEIWEFPEDKSRLIPALRISYLCLPSQLKRCFVYCSLYPKDYEFHKDELILLWMAEDLLLQPKKGKTLEEIGCAYFDELVVRSFFQPSGLDACYFVMHDLMHDLATFYAGEFYFRAEEGGRGNTAEIGIKTRHFSHIAEGNYPISELLAACEKAEHTRTVLGINLRPWSHSFSFEDISQWKYLRVLSFLYRHVDSLPKSIGGLIHLRYMDLSHTYIVILPESFHNLYNLQTLKLKNCLRLKMLPEEMQDLVNLRYLNIKGTPLKEMPKGMSKLEHLQLLSNYIVGKHEENGIRELGALTNLHGSLHISRLENVTNSDEALKAKMLDKKHINILELSWPRNDSIADSQIQEDILDKLEPHKDLEKLVISYYMGKIFPDWLGHPSCHKMTRLELHDCGNCRALPSLGQLPSLKDLHISGFGRLESIGDEFYKNGGSCCEAPFPSLETLEFSRMSCWQEWCSSQFDAFPQLKVLKIGLCTVLKGDLPNYLPALETLSIHNCQHLSCSPPRAPAMLSLGIVNVNEVRLQELACLKSFDIHRYSSVVSLPGACIPSSLQKLAIFYCQKLELSMQQPNETLRQLQLAFISDSVTSFPLNAFPNLETLKIERCENVKILPRAPTTLQSSIDGENEVGMQEPEPPLSLSSISVSGSQPVEDILEAMTRTQFTCLQSLHIGDCSSVVSFPGDCMPASLERLSIWNCKNLAFSIQQPHNLLKWISICSSCDSLKSFPLVAFPNLKELAIYDCENVEGLEVSQSQSEDVVPSCLRKLSIRGCPSFVWFTLRMALPYLETLLIGNCPEIDSFPAGSLLPNLRELHIDRCKKLFRCLTSMEFHLFHLTCLKIENACENVKSFPREGWLPTSLDSLKLLRFPGLETIDCAGLLHLTSLRKLTIEVCPKLKNIAGERLPPSLEKLSIRESYSLGELCKTKDPQIWPKISHIRRIQVDWEQCF